MNADTKIALVTGATSGLGTEITRELARQEYAIMACGLGEREGEQLVGTIEQAGGTASTWTGDLTEPSSCDSVVARAVERFGCIDVLVNCAGVIHRATVGETDDDTWEQTFAINVTVPFRLSRAVVPLMREAGGGAIVNIASLWGLVGGRRAAAYCASKGAIVQLTKAMALDHAADRVRVNAVCPGACDTPMVRAEAATLGSSAEAHLEALAATIPIGRLGTGSDIAHIVAFLASESASYITGVAIPVDGGMSSG